MAISYEVKIKRDNATLVLPDSLTTGTVCDRITALLANVAIPGDEIIIKVWSSEERL